MRRRYNKDLYAVVGVAAIVVVLLSVITYITVLKASATEVTIHVNKLDDQARNNGHKYMVFTDGEVFEDTDSLIFFKTDSSDVWGQLREGHTYVVEVAGWRSTFFSSYRNIIRVIGEK